jgi:uncharacterized protein (DUF302 family)
MRINLMPDDNNHPYGRQLSWQAHACFFNYASGNKLLQDMMSYLKKTIIRTSFDSLVNQLKVELDKEGFEISGATDFQQVFMDKLNLHFKNYKVLAVHIPLLYQTMMQLAPVEGMVLPCNITIIELYPGKIAVIPVNPVELLADGMQNASLRNVAEAVSRRLDIAIQGLKEGSTNIPDLVTSWS